MSGDRARIVYQSVRWLLQLRDWVLLSGHFLKEVEDGAIPKEQARVTAQIYSEVFRGFLRRASHEQENAGSNAPRGQGTGQRAGQAR